MAISVTSVSFGGAAVAELRALCRIPLEPTASRVDLVWLKKSTNAGHIATVASSVRDHPYISSLESSYPTDKRSKSPLNPPKCSLYGTSFSSFAFSPTLSHFSHAHSPSTPHHSRPLLNLRCHQRRHHGQAQQEVQRGLH